MIVLGLIGLMIIALFIEITVNSEEEYYLLKETTEASMIDAIDYAYYRDTGELKIAKDFVKSKKNKYIVAKFEEDGTIFADDKYLYKVKGLIEPIQNVIGTEPPIFVDATLLEFKGQIIYDGFILPYGISIGKNIKNMLNNELKDTKIINSFDEIARSDKKWLK